MAENSIMPGNQKKSGIGFCAKITIGLIFLINPMIDLLDFLPDFIGLFILARALDDIARFEVRIEAADRHLLHLAVISLIKTCVLILFPINQSSFIMLFCFSFAVLDLIFFFMFAADFFPGVEYLLNRNNGEFGLASLSNLKTMTVIFYVFSRVADVLPTLSSILEDMAHEDLTNAQKYLTWAKSKILFVIVGAVGVLIFGLFLIRAYRKFIKSAQADKSFTEGFAKRVEEQKEYLPARKLYLKIKSVAAGILLGALFLIEFRPDGIDFLPDIIGFLLIFVSLLRLDVKGKVKNALPVTLIACAAFVGREVCYRIYGTNLSVNSTVTDKRALFFVIVELIYAFAVMLFIFFSAKVYSRFCGKYIYTEILSDFDLLLIIAAFSGAARICSAAFPTAEPAVLFLNFTAAFCGFFFLRRVLANTADSYAEKTGLDD